MGARHGSCQGIPQVLCNTDTSRLEVASHGDHFAEILYFETFWIILHKLLGGAVEVTPQDPRALPGRQSRCHLLEEVQIVPAPDSGMRFRPMLTGLNLEQSNWSQPHPGHFFDTDDSRNGVL